MRVAALLFALQIIGPFDPGPRPWARDTSENVLRQVHQGAFDGRTTMWVRVRPKSDDPLVAPTAFAFVVEFVGSAARTRPPVTWQIDTDVRFYPQIQRVPRLDLSIDGAPPINLLAPGEPSSVGYCCGDTAIPASVSVALSVERLDHLAAARSVSGNALGVPFALDRRQLQAIAEFRRRLPPG